jgi:hypothetical protein
MLREVILSSVGAKISMATNSLSELPSKEVRKRTPSLLKNFPEFVV